VGFEKKKHILLRRLAIMCQRVLNALWSSYQRILGYLWTYFQEDYPSNIQSGNFDTSKEFII
jgi:hypothetical protein